MHEEASQDSGTLSPMGDIDRWAITSRYTRRVAQFMHEVIRPTVEGPEVREPVEVVRADAYRGVVEDNERLREALAQCQNTSDSAVYRWAGNALAGRRWNDGGGQ
jgi:hypothetical protein